MEINNERRNHYFDLARKFLRLFFDSIELHGEGPTVRTAIDIANRLQDNGLATIKRFKTSSYCSGSDEPISQMKVILSKTNEFEKIDDALRLAKEERFKVYEERAKARKDLRDIQQKEEEERMLKQTERSSHIMVQPEGKSISSEEEGEFQEERL